MRLHDAIHARTILLLLRRRRLLTPNTASAGTSFDNIHGTTQTHALPTHTGTHCTHTLLVGHAALATHALAIELWAGQLNHLPNVQHIYSTATDRLFIYVYIIRYTLFSFLSFCSLSFICFIGMLTAFSAQFTRDRTVTVTVTVHSHRTLIDLDDLI